ncbi:hypothetical protein NL64_04670 [Pseudomonas fluorescens]|jgi:hypothetical protein|nr:hypothetical protein NL64_04670 [Pseudomonas fluorescens]
MIKHLIPPVLIAVVIALSGSSCHDPGKDESVTASQAPPINGGGARMIPAQQRMPSTMPRPRR